MIVRKLDKQGDMTFGHGRLDYFENSPEGVVQNVRTRLALWQGQWFLDIEEGTPWLQQILGKKLAIDVVIRTRILQTPYVDSITSFQSVVNPDTRTLTITCELQTEYGIAELAETI